MCEVHALSDLDLMSGGCLRVGGSLDLDLGDAEEEKEETEDRVVRRPYRHGTVIRNMLSDARRKGREELAEGIQRTMKYRKGVK